ncbi:MAG: phosphoribosylamine--glycine ligase [Candidatus Sumerlaeia bacterium]|nr:phosphoribosylamine--glycine ligase [Candidatus Sumerlaeia bacterium]
MNVLLIGSGGREHALAWKLKQSKSVTRLVCPNGNPGISREAETPRVHLPTPQSWAEYALAEKIDLVVIGPEQPLSEGVGDALMQVGIPVFGPRKAAARLESSKAFSKEVMRSAGIPTAASETFTDYAKALDYARSLRFPVVVKADGLAAGKGVSICEDQAQLEQALGENLLQGRFGESSKQVLVEEFLHGQEASLLALCDGKDVFLLAPSQDHKRAHDGDLGPNTGGMGTYAPAPIVTEEVLSATLGSVMLPALREMERRGTPYVGVLYAGLMIAPSGEINVLEFNCRFGDPETQVVLPLLDGDLALALLACAEGRLATHLSPKSGHALTLRPESAACVVIASGGYPGEFAKGKVISGLDQDFGPNAMVFHAGTGLNNSGEVVTSGGRVLGVTAWGPTLRSAVDRAYGLTAKIHFDSMYYRKDIAHRAL